jgi:hypothetical protein
VISRWPRLFHLNPPIEVNRLSHYSCDVRDDENIRNIVWGASRLREYSIYTLHPLSDFALAALVHLNRLLVQPTEDSLLYKIFAWQDGVDSGTTGSSSESSDWGEQVKPLLLRWMIGQTKLVIPLISCSNKCQHGKRLHYSIANLVIRHRLYKIFAWQDGVDSGTTGSSSESSDWGEQVKPWSVRQNWSFR